ncbi:SH3 domain-containing protein [Listeria kieliensis]
MNKHFTVKKDHHPEISKPLFANKNEEIWVFDEDKAYPGWMLCKIKSSGVEGYIPEQIIARVPDSKSGTVLEDYSARELDVEEGDKLESNRELNGWAWCIDEDGTGGWIPLKNLKEE